jgi:ferredoxin
MWIEVDRDRCDATGLCAAIAPELFQLDQDDVLLMRTPPPDKALWEVAEQAARACPKLAITVREGTGPCD